MSASTTDFPKKEDAVYELVLNDPGFVNDLWNTLDATSKVSTLKLAGFNVIKEYQDSVERNYE